MNAALAPTRRESELRRLELAVTHRLDGLLQGDHLGLVPAAGSEAGEGRAYTPGDDVRRIDWNLTARSGSTHVRDTIADRELETWLLVDGSASLDFGTAECEKRDRALAAAAAFGFLTNRSGNRVAALVLDGERTTLVPPRSGRDAVLGILHRLDTRGRVAPGADGGDLAGLIRRSRLTCARRGLVVVISDFLDRSDWAKELRSAATRHQVVAVHITDPREHDLPPVGLLTLVDPETGRRREVQTSSRRLRERYAAAAAAQHDGIVGRIRAAGAAHLPLSTDRDWMLDIVRYASRRHIR